MSSKRVIVLIHMDCFYVQVEQRLHPEYTGRPCAVVQRGGSIVAVSYEARKFGVKRGEFGDDANKLCPDCHLFRIPEKRGKADLQRYWEAGYEVIRALSKFTNWIERDSVDEAFLDITDLVRERRESPNLREEISESHVATYKSRRGSKKWFDSEVSLEDRDLAVGACVVGEMRKHILEETQFHCSAGVARNKNLAELACGLRKPKGQTILPRSCVQKLFEEIPVDKMPNLGGKLGSRVMEQLGVTYMSEVYIMGRDRLREILGDREGDYVFAMSEGTCSDEVRKRQLTNSISCEKKFLGPDTLKTPDAVKYWLKQLSLEVVERVRKDQQTNQRRPLTISLHFRPLETKHGITRAAPFSADCADRISEICWLAISGEKVPPRLLKGRETEENELWEYTGVSAITSLAMSACNFTPISDKRIQNKLSCSADSNDMPSPIQIEHSVNSDENGSESPLVLEIDPRTHPAIIALKEDIDAQFAKNFPERGRDFTYTKRSSHSNPAPRTDAEAFLQAIPHAKRVSISHLPTMRDYDVTSDAPEPFNYRTNVMLTARGIDVPTMHCLPLDMQEAILQLLEDDRRLNRHLSLKLEDYSPSSNSNFGFAAKKKEKNVKCLVCNESVPRSKLQEHKDSHLAHAIHDIAEVKYPEPRPAVIPPLSKKRKVNSVMRIGKRGRKKLCGKPSVTNCQPTLNTFFNRGAIV